MICNPCREAADNEAIYQLITGAPSGLKSAHPKDCGCTCQHKEIGTLMNDRSRFYRGLERGA